MRPGLLFDVTRRSDRLLVQLTGRPGGAPGVPAVGVALSYKVVGAQITFEPGPDGRAARLILHQNSRDQMAEWIE